MLQFIKGFFRIGFGLGTLASIVGIGSGINSLMNSGNPQYGGMGGAPGGQYYIPSGQSSADSSWQQALAQLMGNQQNTAANVTPELYQTFLNQAGINTQPMVQAGQDAGAAYGQNAQLAQMLSSMLGGQAGQNFGNASQIMNTAMDPQQALYNRTAQQTQDQTRAAESASGVAMSPYGAGLESQAMNNFNIDWQNAQLGRQVSGAGAATQLGQLGGQDVSGAYGMAGQVPTNLLQSGTVPAQTAMTAYGMPAQAAQNYASGMTSAVSSPYSGIMSQIIPYLTYGSGATNNAFTGSMAGQAQNQSMTNQGINTIMSGLGTGSQNGLGNWLGSLFSTPQGGYGGGVGTTSSYANMGGVDSGAGFSA